MIATLSPDAVIARLEPLQAAGTIAFAGGLGSISDAPQNTLASNSVFVFPPSKAGGQNNSGTMKVNQPVVLQIAVAIVFKGIGTGGAALTTEMQAICDAVEAQLFGWVPGSGLSPLSLVTARADQVDPLQGYMIYAFLFETKGHARSP